MRTTIGELAAAGVLSFGDGYRTRRDQLRQPGYRILRVADVAEGTVDRTGPDFVSEEFTSQIGPKLSQPGDILLSTKGTIGRVAEMPAGERVVYSPQLSYFRLNDEDRLSRRFLFLWFRSAEFVRQASHRANNTDMAPYINLADIRSLEIEVPPIAVQRGIAEVLGAFDDKIAANRATTRSAEALMTVMLDSSELSVPVNAIARRSADTVQPSTVGSSCRHFSLPAFDDGKVPVNEATVEIKSAKQLLRAPSVLVSKLNPRFPRVWNIPTIGPNDLASTEFVVLEPVEEVTTHELWASLATPALGRHLESRVSGTSGSHQRVKPSDVLDALVGDPRSLTPDSRALVRASGSLCESVRAESVVLAKTRDELLPLLMSGKLTVKAAEKRAEEVL